MLIEKFKFRSMELNFPLETHGTTGVEFREMNGARHCEAFRESVDDPADARWR